MKKILIGFFVAIIIFGAGYFIWKSGSGAKVSETIVVPADNEQPMQQKMLEPPTTQEITTVQEQKTMKARMTTNFGTIKLELYADKTPVTVSNFVKLADAGFYNGVKFHRVIKGFMIQGGDPLTKDDSKKEQWGMGGPGYTFADEKFSGEYARGTLAMANAGPNTNGSQFFIMHKDYPLPPNYVIFGKVVEGMEAVDKIAELGTGAKDCPLQDAVIESIAIEK